MADWIAALLGPEGTELHFIATRSRSSPPPRFPSGQHVILEPEHFGSLEIAVDLKPNLPTEMMRPQLADGGEWLLPAGPADAKQIAEVRGLRVQVRALPGGSHAVWASSSFPCLHKSEHREIGTDIRRRRHPDASARCSDAHTVAIPVPDVLTLVNRPALGKV
jgi:hypothetical protein